MPLCNNMLMSDCRNCAYMRVVACLAQCECGFIVSLMLRSACHIGCVACGMVQCTGAGAVSTCVSCLVQCECGL